MKTLVKWNGNGQNPMFPEIPSIFDDFITRDLFHLPFRTDIAKISVPAVNIKENETAYELEMAAPGMEKTDFKIELVKDTLVVSAHKENKVEEKTDDGKYSRKEFSYHSFSRSFNLPPDLVQDDTISATYKDGILQITVPKKDSSKESLKKLIAIN
ncbi:MAG: Hsp20/alpha crystallin family protein [Bacteroidota bacterium]